MVDKVWDLRVSLVEKKVQFEQKDVEVNEKLQRMVVDQCEVEQRKNVLLEIQVVFGKQEVEVVFCKKFVLEDLVKVELVVEVVKVSVGNIKKFQFIEVRFMFVFLFGVRLVFDLVCILIGYKVNDWKQIQVVVCCDDFIVSIINFDNERQMIKVLRMKMWNEFLVNFEFIFEKVNCVFKVCGLFVQWVEVQVQYVEILDCVGLLREEVWQFEEQVFQIKVEVKVVEQMIENFEVSIVIYKVEYVLLISEMQVIKLEMLRV